MKAKTIFLIAALAILAGSCIPSLFPLYTQDDLLYDERLEGTWEDGDNGIWIIERLEYHNRGIFDYPFDPTWIEPDQDSDSLSIRYRLTVKEFVEGDTVEAEFLIHLLRLGDQQYVNFYPDDYDLHHGFLHWHMVQANNFSKISISEDRLTLRFFDPDYLRQMIEKNRIRISHVWLDDFILLTAPTPELQKFVIKYGNEEDALTGPEVFNRI